MENDLYLEQFQQAVNRLDESLFNQAGLQLKVGVWMDSVVLKIQKPSWRNAISIPFKDSVFFSVWVSDQSVRENKISYNIHALKLRQLTGFSIKSREFAEAFRSGFKPFENDWPNIRVDFGPLTLMEGWVDLDTDNLEAIVAGLATKFLTIQHLIDGLLAERKKG